MSAEELSIQPSSHSKNIMYHVLTLYGDSYDIPQHYIANDGKDKYIDTILNIKEFIECRHNIPSRLQRLIFAGQELLDKTKIQEANLHKHTTIHLVIVKEPDSKQETAVVDYIDKLTDYIKEQISNSENVRKRPEFVLELNEVSSALKRACSSMNNLADYVDRNSCSTIS